MNSAVLDVNSAVLALSDIILVTCDPQRLSYESVYRTMYQWTRGYCKHLDKQSKACRYVCGHNEKAQAMQKYLLRKFSRGEWLHLDSWVMLQDCWLYANKDYPILQQTFDRILSTIRCYPRLLGFICEKYQVVPDIERYIASMVW